MQSQTSDFTPAAATRWTRWNNVVFDSVSLTSSWRHPQNWKKITYTVQCNNRMTVTDTRYMYSRSVKYGHVVVETCPWTDNGWCSVYLGWVNDSWLHHVHIFVVQSIIADLIFILHHSRDHIISINTSVCSNCVAWNTQSLADQLDPYTRTMLTEPCGPTQPLHTHNVNKALRTNSTPTQAHC